MAKDPKLDLAPDENLETAEEMTRPRSYRMHILVLLIGVVLAQATLLFFLLPSPADMQNALKRLSDPEVIKGIEGVEVPPNVLPNAESKAEEYDEKELGEKFVVQTVRPGPDQTIDSFSVTVIVRVFKNDSSAYDKLFEKHKFAIREAVENVLRAASLDDRNQLTLLTIKQRIMKAINEVIGEPYIRGVICNDAKTDMM